MKKFIKRHNIFRVTRFYNRGFSELGGVLGNLDNLTKQEFHIKRANWVHNLVSFKKTFCSKFESQM